MSVAAMDMNERGVGIPSAASGTRTWWQLVFLFGALLVLTLGAHLVDERELNGVAVWVKPLKFQASLALHFATLAVLASLLRPARRRSAAFPVVVSVSAGAALFEIAWIMFQAGRGRASHFNEETLVEGVMYGFMGLGSVLLVAAPFILGFWLLRDERRRLLADPLRLGAMLGLVLAPIWTLIVAGTMSSHGSPWVGAAAGGSGVPIFGWSREGGDLRVAHFFATHAMQCLPLAGFVLRDAGARGCRWLLAGSGMYALFTAGVFVQALLGRPFPGQY